MCKDTKPSINWDHVHPDYNYLAKERSGTVFLYKEKPFLKVGYWDSYAQSESALAILSLNKGTCDWKDSLIKRPTE